MRLDRYRNASIWGTVGNARKTLPHLVETVRRRDKRSYGGRAARRDPTERNQSRDRRLQRSPCTRLRPSRFHDLRQIVSSLRVPTTPVTHAELRLQGHDGLYRGCSRARRHTLGKRDVQARSLSRALLKRPATSSLC